MSDLFDTGDDSTDLVTLHIDGTEQPVHSGTTPRDLKQEREDIADEGQFTFRTEDDKLRSIPDDEPVLDYVEPGQSVNVQPVKGDVFGHAGYSAV